MVNSMDTTTSDPPLIPPPVTEIYSDDTAMRREPPAQSTRLLKWTTEMNAELNYPPPPPREYMLPPRRDCDEHLYYTANHPSPFVYNGGTLRSGQRSNAHSPVVALHQHCPHACCSMVTSSPTVPHETPPSTSSTSAASNKYACSSSLSRKSPHNSSSSPPEAFFHPPPPPATAVPPLPDFAQLMASGDKQHKLQAASKRRKRKSRAKNDVNSNGDLILPGHYGASTGKRRNGISCKRACFVTLCAVLVLALLGSASLAVLRLLVGPNSNSTMQGSSAWEETTSFEFPISDQLRMGSEREVPARVRVGLPTRLVLPSRRISYTQLNVEGDHNMLLNFSMPPDTRMVLYMRRSLRPTPTQFDFQRIISADHLHLLNTAGGGTSLKHAVITHHLSRGIWQMGLLNDHPKAKEIWLVVHKTIELHPSSAGDCGPNECHGKGECLDGRCRCYPGYVGAHCEETACPVLCSGNGVFAEGRCRCHTGFRGAECESSFAAPRSCTPSTCNRHGQCSVDEDVVECTCEQGWGGEFCDQATCSSPDCSGHGICERGHCYCASGWWGDGCERAADGLRSGATDGVIVRNSSHVHTSNSGGEMPIRCDPLCGENGLCSGDVCNCFQGWGGVSCLIEECKGNCTQGAGQCIKFNLGESRWRCECNSDRFGPNCEYRKETVCDDGLDNDGDGLTDCEDSECCSDRACLSSPICLSVPKPIKRNYWTDNSTGNFIDRVRFLFSGVDAVQRYADEKLLEPAKISVIRGTVLSSRGGPLVGTRVSSVEQTQLGFTVTRSGEEAGRFDLAVNGGRTVELLFLRQPFGKVTRSFYVEANRLVDIGVVYMDRS